MGYRLFFIDCWLTPHLKGVVYKLESLPDDSYELYILVDSNKFDFEIKLHESEIEDIKVLEHNAIERGKTFNIGF